MVQLTQLLAVENVTVIEAFGILVSTDHHTVIVDLRNLGLEFPMQVFVSEREGQFWRIGCSGRSNCEEQYKPKYTQHQFEGFHRNLVTALSEMDLEAEPRKVNRN